MRRFDVNAKCVMCGYEDVGVHHGEGHWDGFELLPFEGHWLRRTCRRCGYHWYELPLDAEPPDVPKTQPDVVPQSIDNWSYVPTGQYQDMVHKAECWRRFCDMGSPSQIWPVGMGWWRGTRGKGGHLDFVSAEAALDYALGEDKAG